MKRLLAALLAFTMIILGVFSLASCGVGTAPELDFDDAKEALEEAGYEVRINEEPSSVDLEKTLYATKEGKTISIKVYKDSKSAKLAYEELKFQYDAGMDYAKLEIKQLKNKLNKYEDKLSSAEIDEIEDDIKEIEEELEEMKNETSFGRRGKIIWEGDVEAAKASKG